MKSETETASGAPRTTPQRWIRSRIGAHSNSRTAASMPAATGFSTRCLTTSRTRHLAMASLSARCGDCWGPITPPAAMPRRWLTTLAHKECVKLVTLTGAEIYRRNLAVIGG